MGIVYAVLYLCFMACPISFRDNLGWSHGLSSLVFYGVGLSTVIIILLEPVIWRVANSYPKDLTTGKTPHEATMSVICVSGILVGQLWFASTSTPDVHWIASTLAEIPSDVGYDGIFVCGQNFLPNSYGIYAASALAGNIVTRSVLGTVLPLDSLSLGLNWADTLLSIIITLCVPLPFVFYFKRGKIHPKKKAIWRLNAEKAVG